MAKRGASPGERRGGRQKGTPNKATAARQAKIAKSGIMPLDYMLKVLRAKKSTDEQKAWAAVAAAPYCHPKLAAVSYSGPAGGGAIPHEHSLAPELHELLERIVGRPAK